MSTSSPGDLSIWSLSTIFTEHHCRGAAAFAAAVGYALVVALSGWPVALLAGLFVPLSLGTESALRAARAERPGCRGEALATGLGVVVGAVATGLVVFAAGTISP